MPRIPSAQDAGLGELRARSAPAAPSASQNIQANPDTFGANQGRTLQRAGQALFQAGQVAAEVEQQNAALEAAELETQAQKEMLSFFYDGDNALLNTRGADALTASDTFKNKMDEVRKKYSGQVKSPLANQLLTKSFEKMELYGAETALKHASAQRRAYASDLANARVALNQETAALNYTDDDLFADSLEETRQAAIISAKLNGFKEGDQAYKKTIRDAVSGQYTARIKALIATDEPENIVRAADLLETGYNDDNISLSESLALRTTLKTLLPEAKAKVELDEMGAFVTDQNTAIEFVVNELEGGGQVVDDGDKPGDGVIAKYGINSAKNEGVDVKNLSYQGAAAIYKEKYWDANNIDALPPAMRLVAFDTYVNGFDPKVLGKTAAEAIEEADGDPEKLIETRLEYYKKLAEVNPAKAKNLEGWYNRMKKLAAASRAGTYDMADVYNRANQLDEDTGAQLIKLAGDHNNNQKYTAIGINSSLMRLVQDETISDQDKLNAIDTAEINGKIKDGYAADLRKVIKGPKENITDEQKLEAFQALDEDLKDLRLRFDSDTEKFGSIKVTSENLDAYRAYQEKVFRQVSQGLITSAEGKAFLEDFTGGVYKAVEEGRVDGEWTYINGIQDPYDRGFKAIDALLKKEGREDDSRYRRELIFAFRNSLGSFDEKGNYVADGKYDSTGDKEQDEKVILKALDMARRSVAFNNKPILATLGGTVNASISQGTRTDVSTAPSDVKPQSDVKANFVVRTGKDGKKYRVFADGRYEVIQ